MQAELVPIPSVEEKRAELRAVLASETLFRSEQLRAFLRFVCEKEMAGTAGQITEYDIGVEALGRPASYSPAEDSSVRTRAYELRQRLQRYYTVESPGAVVRIELPRGAYAPRFVSWPTVPKIPVPAVVSAPDVLPVPKVLPIPDVSPTPKVLPVPDLLPGPEQEVTRKADSVSRWRGWAGAFFCGVAVMGAAAFVVHTRGGPTAPGPDLREAWGPVALKDQEVLICLAAPLHYLVSPYAERVPDERQRVAVPDEAYALFSRYRSLTKGEKLQLEPVQKAMTMGNVQGLARVLGVLGNFGAQYRLLPETNSPLPAMRRKSVVLFGSPWYSRAAATLLEKTPWTLARDGPSKEIGLIGTGTQAGRVFLPSRGTRGEYLEVFGLVTVLPSDPSADDGHTIVVFSGLTSAGTHGAAAFFTSEKDLGSLGARFRQEGLRSWPRSYQVVVRCRTSEDAQLLTYSYQTHVVLEK